MYRKLWSEDDDGFIYSPTGARFDGGDSIGLLIGLLNDLEQDKRALLTALQAAEGIVDWALDNGANPGARAVLRMVQTAIAKATE